MAAKRSATACIEELFFENYLKFFQRAEEKRRWNMERDIPWDKVNPEASCLTATIVQFFSAVEMYLPDYTSKMMQMIRQSRGRAWFHANWGYEESKHSIVLEDWLLRSGKRTEEQIRDRLVGLQLKVGLNALAVEVVVRALIRSDPAQKSSEG